MALDNRRLYQLIVLTSKYKALKKEEDDCGVEVTEELEYFRDIEEALLELNVERTKKELVISVCLDDYIGKLCTVTLKDGRTITGFLTTDSRYLVDSRCLNIVDRSTNEPYSFCDKDVQTVQRVL